MLFAMANSGLPGTSGFVGEFLVIMGAMSKNFWYAFAAAMTLVIGAAYTLWMYKRVVFGKIENSEVQSLQDLSFREAFTLSILGICVLWMGVYPASFTQFLHGPINEILTHVAISKL